MQLAGILIIGLVLLVVALGVARVTTFSHDVDDFVDDVGGHLSLAQAWLGHTYRTSVLPAVMRLGWVAIAILVFGVVTCMWDSIFGKDVNGLGMLPVLAVTIMSGFGLVWTMFRSQKSALSLVAWATISLVATGLTSVLVADFCHAPGLAIVGTIQVLSGIGSAYAFARIVTLLGVKAVDFGEGVLGTFWKLGGLIATATSKQQLEKMFAAKGPNLANQEDFVPKVNAFFRSLIASIGPLLAGSIIFYHPAVLLICGVVGVVIRLAWFGLEAVGFSTLGLRRNSALMISSFSYLGVFAYSMLVVFEAMGFGVNVALMRIGAMLAIHKLFGFVIAQMVLVLLIPALALGMAFLWPRGQYAWLPRTRKFAAIPVALALMGCITGLAWAAVGDKATNIAQAATNGVLLTFSPSVEGTQTPGVKVSWPDYPGATEYRLERRELHEQAYKAVVSDSFVKGAKAYEDTTVVRGKTYFYRVVAVGAGADGGDKLSTEQEVKVPAEIQKVEPPPTKVVPASTGRSGNGSGNGCGKNGCDMSEDLSELCRRYPASCHI